MAQTITSVHKVSLANILLQCFSGWSLTLSLHITSYEEVQGGEVGGGIALTSREAACSIP